MHMPTRPSALLQAALTRLRSTSIRARTWTMVAASMRAARTAVEPTTTRRRQLTRACVLHPTRGVPTPPRSTTMPSSPRTTGAASSQAARIRPRWRSIRKQRLLTLARVGRGGECRARARAAPFPWRQTTMRRVPHSPLKTSKRAAFPWQDAQIASPPTTCRMQPKTAEPASIPSTVALPIRLSISTRRRLCSRAASTRSWVAPTQGRPHTWRPRTQTTGRVCMISSGAPTIPRATSTRPRPSLLVASFPSRAALIPTQTTMLQMRRCLRRAHMT